MVFWPDISSIAATDRGPNFCELFRGWTESEAFWQRQLAVLKSDIAKGIADLEDGLKEVNSRKW